MQIKKSRYCRPFVEPPQPGVVFIAHDDWFDLIEGRHDSHVKFYCSYMEGLPTVLEVHDHLSDTTTFHEVDSTYLRPMSSSPQPLNETEREFLESLYMDSGIKAAGRRIGRLL